MRINLNIVGPKGMTMQISLSEFKRGYQAFQAHEARDAMYKIATFVISQFWGRPADMADGLGVLLLTWNQAFYRYGSFDFDRLEHVIHDTFPAVASYRDRDIETFETSDEVVIKNLFGQFLDALQIGNGKMKGRKSPVAVSKALHLLGPGFFPLWDDRISRAYDCHYAYQPAEKYVTFSHKMKEIARQIGTYVPSGNKTLLKLIDEYNYAKFTKAWI